MTTLQPSNTRAEKLVALPSLSCGLSSLPQAKSMDSVSLHPNMYAQRAAQSEAKLKNVLSKTASNSQNPPPIPAYMNPPHHNPNSPSSSPPLMMRKSTSCISAEVPGRKVQSIGSVLRAPQFSPGTPRRILKLKRDRGGSSEYPLLRFAFSEASSPCPMDILYAPPTVQRGVKGAECHCGKAE
ncbi:hypothetical protein CY34DRAFT_13255 [Suillus luteus UH-Slu-Lm8-n1]|uniref:Uncharacterized protein n=1 Tax=Suillus luteus UH-Slu-Lm8-n1 TaxID=930992 RepID=A0A0D0BCD8_9AGAM|nr:hypothetical protein CY34DRAFT_13255 [Suillus luteus UH-Slu-Lm8-n1]